MHGQLAVGGKHALLDASNRVCGGRVADDDGGTGLCNNRNLTVTQASNDKHIEFEEADMHRKVAKWSSLVND